MRNQPNNWGELLSCFDLTNTQRRKDLYPFILAALIKQSGGVIELNDAEMRACYANAKSTNPWPMKIATTPNGMRMSVEDPVGVS